MCKTAVMTDFNACPKPERPDSLCGDRGMRATWPFGRWRPPLVAFIVMPGCGNYASTLRQLYDDRAALPGWLAKLSSASSVASGCSVMSA